MTLPRNRFTVLALLWLMAGIYALLFREADGGAPPFPHFDKFAHFCLFLAQFWLCAKAFIHENQTIPYRGLLILALLYALGSEMAQALLTSTRQGSFFDGAADLAGAALALWLAHSKTVNRTPDGC